MSKFKKPILIVLAILAVAMFFLPQFTAKVDFKEMEVYIINKNRYTQATAEAVEGIGEEEVEMTEESEADLLLEPYKRNLAVGEASILNLFTSIDDLQLILTDGIAYRLEKSSNAQSADVNAAVKENFISITDKYIGFASTYNYVAIIGNILGCLFSICLVVVLFTQAKPKTWFLIAIAGFISLAVGGYAFNVAVSIAADGMSVASLQVGLPNLHKYVFFGLSNGYWYAVYALGLIAFLYAFKAFRVEKPTV